MADPVLDRIRQKKMMEMQEQINSSIGQDYQEQQMMQKELSQLEQMVKSRMTKQAVERYSNIKIAYPDRIMQLLVVLGQGLQTGKVNMIDDDLLKEILGRLETKKPKFNIRR